MDPTVTPTVVPVSEIGQVSSVRPVEFVDLDQQFKPEGPVVFDQEAPQAKAIKAELDQLKQPSPDIVEPIKDNRQTDQGVQAMAQTDPNTPAGAQPVVSPAQQIFEAAIKNAPGYQLSDNVISAADRFAQGPAQEAATAAGLKAGSIWLRTLKLAA
ncbi:hypothetical protein JW962_03745 [Candidatus Dojkabacteria bacterium]|nr:hypothetical protein [Candidatus Dojkabacteria bacterium]